MRRLAAAALVLVVTASLLASFVAVEQGGGSPVPTSSATATTSPVLNSFEFPSTVDTSSTVWEYPMIARALMLAGGSTDVALGDINGDGLTDLVVGVAGANVVSVFYRQSDGKLPSTPSANISLDSVPVRVGVIDAFSVGQSQVLVLERRINDFDQENLKIFNYTGPATPFAEFKNVSVYKTATEFVVGMFDGDSWPDIALVCPTLTPDSSNGMVEVRWGPDYGTNYLFFSGRGSLSITCGFFDGDDLVDLAVANYWDSTIHIFSQPFLPGSPPSSILFLQGNPTDLSAGRFNNDMLDDLAIVTENPSALRFFLQAGGLPSTETYNRLLAFPPSHVAPGRINSDSLDDIIILSSDRSIACSYLQLSAYPTWPTTPNYLFPTGYRPLAALCGQLDDEPANEVAVASSRPDGSGSSIAIYDFEDSWLSNSNATAWTNAYYAATALTSGDIDGNDVADLILSHPEVGAFGYMLGDKLSGYSSGESLHLLGYTPGEIVSLDLTGDAVSEIVVSAAGGTDFWTYSWDFSSPSSFKSCNSTCTGTITDIAQGDFNNDSLQDIAASTEKGTIEIFYGTGGWPAFGSSADLIIYEDYVSGWTLAVGDFNSDGLDDIAYPYPYCKIGIV
ncbi:MAG: VCBS repeat-containing protein, partial [Thermoplasmata archaeon]